jgi:Cu+-exporting ATPase
MDSVKDWIFKESEKMYLTNIESLFPEMAEKYEYFPCEIKETEILRQKENEPDFHFICGEFLNKNKEFSSFTYKNHFKKGMFIKVKKGDCFPVDGLIIEGSTVVDTSLVTGEPCQAKNLGDLIPAGAVNLDNQVIIYAKTDNFHSTLTKLLFRANRVDKEVKPKEKPKSNTFAYAYGGFIFLSLALSIIIPIALGIFTIPLMLQNFTAIVFFLCPCTWSISEELPKLLTKYKLHKKGIVERRKIWGEEKEVTADIFVFDKTGTLTDGQSLVESMYGISDVLWEKIYLLEVQGGGGHPIAKAIVKQFGPPSENLSDNVLKKDLVNIQADPKKRGICGVVQGTKIQIGSASYLSGAEITIDPQFEHFPEIKKGCTPVYVSEDGKCKGVIFIKHNVRKKMLNSLLGLKEQKKELFMITGDTNESAINLNKQIGDIFDEKNIYAAQTPEMKEKFFQERKNKKMGFFCDGLNDSLAAKQVSENGGFSCAITSKEKAAAFTDLTLDGSLTYLFKKPKINRFLKKNKAQNKWLIFYSSLSFLGVLIAFSIAGIGVPPLLPLLMMASTTLFVLFNAYRVSINIDTILDQEPSLIRQFFASDLSFALLVAGSTLLLSNIIFSTLSAGAFLVPVISFTAGTAIIISSSILIGAISCFGLFGLMAAVYLTYECFVTEDNQIELSQPGLATDNHFKKHLTTTDRVSSQIWETPADITESSSGSYPLNFTS